MKKSWEKKKEIHRDLLDAPEGEKQLTWAGSPLARSERGLIQPDVQQEVPFFGT